MLMDNAVLVVTQALILFILIGVGFLVRKVRMMDDTGLQQMNTLLLVIVNPCLIIQSFQNSFDRGLIHGIVVALLAALVTHGVGAVLARLVFRRLPQAQSRILQFSTIFSNCAFMGVPLLNALLGSEGVLYGSVYIAVYNALSWTYGVILLTGNHREMNIRKALINPGTVAIFIALPLFLLQIRLPVVPLTIIDYLAALNAPLAMIIIGAQMAVIPFFSLFRHKAVYISAFLRLLLIPGVMLFLLSFFRLDRTVLLACLIPAMAPTGIVSTLFAIRYKQDAALATRSVALSTLFSIVTMPLMIVFTDWFSRF